jgi:hypothetical protein
MAVIIRIDVDRPFGKKSILHQAASRVASELYFPKLKALNYLRDLEEILLLFNEKNIPAYVFFRRCSFPSLPVIRLMRAGNHVFGLHLENSRSLECFKAEMHNLEDHIDGGVKVFSKHGSGVHRYGLFHYAPYEPEKYQIWGRELGMEIFFGNLEDPTIKPYVFDLGLKVFPSAFWLEPHWRDAKRFTVEWLCEASSSRDIVILLHPVNNCKFSLSFNS